MWWWCAGGPACLPPPYVGAVELVQLEGRVPIGCLLVPTLLSLAASSQPLAARPRMPSSLPGVGSFAPEDVRITAMAQRVKEVLPHVPLDVIRTDLGKHRPRVLAGTDHLPCHVSMIPESRNPCPCCTVEHDGSKSMLQSGNSASYLTHPLCSYSPNELCGYHHCQLAGGESALLP